MIRFEVEQREPASKGDGCRLCREWIRHRAAFSRVAPPLHERSPERRIDRIRIAKLAQVGRHDIDARPAHRIEQGRVHPAIHIVDRVGDEQDRKIRPRLLALDQLLDELAAERTMHCLRRAHEIVDQEEVRDDEALCLIDDAEHFIEDSLLVLGPAIRVGIREVIEEGDLLRLDTHGLGRDVRPARHRFNRLPRADSDPPGEYDTEYESLADEAAASCLFFGISAHGWIPTLTQFRLASNLPSS